MKKIFPIFTSVLMLMFVFSISSCAKNYVRKIDLSEINEIQYNEKWAVITSPYTTFYEKPEISKNSTKHGRKGDISKIYGKSTEVKANKDAVVWYKLEEGWIEEDDILICNNRLQAENSARNLN